ncbi:MAG: Uma2 family endonuclease, partial [Chloroflexi bacterium]|nr:Uma2 family endonuclease [Chloroflexota bacterium]
WVPAHCEQSYHLFYLLMPSLEARQGLMAHLKERGILAVFHYLPLHLSEMGRRFGGREGARPVFDDRWQKTDDRRMYRAKPGPATDDGWRMYALRTTDSQSEQGEGRTFLAAANMGLFASAHRPPVVPDVFLSLDVEVAEEWWDKRHRTYFFWEFGKSPEVVIEVVSNRKGGETGAKMREYALMGIPYYVIFDPLEQVQKGVLRAYELSAGREYVKTKPELLSGVSLGLRLWRGVYVGKEDVWLRWQDKAGELILTGSDGV